MWKALGILTKATGVKDCLEWVGLKENRRVHEHEQLFGGVWLQEPHVQRNFPCFCFCHDRLSLRYEDCLCPAPCILEYKAMLIFDLAGNPFYSSLPECPLFTSTSAASKLQQLLNPTADSNPSSTVQLPFLICIPSALSDSFILLFLFIIFSPLFLLHTF